MLSEEVKEMRLQHMSLVPTEGACKFCGQITAIEVPGDWLDEEKNEYATEMCKCPEADWYRLDKLKKEKGRKRVRSLFERDQSDVVRKFLQEAVELIADEDSSSITVKIDDVTKADIKTGSKGGIRVERTDTTKQMEE